jgi:hypothetical protein
MHPPCTRPLFCLWYFTTRTYKSTISILIMYLRLTFL